MQHRLKSHLHGFVQGKFYEAIVQSIDIKSKSLVACFPDDLGMETACFKLDYDILVLGMHIASRASLTRNFLCCLHAIVQECKVNLVHMSHGEFVVHKLEMGIACFKYSRKLLLASYFLDMGI